MRIKGTYYNATLGAAPTSVTIGATGTTGPAPYLGSFYIGFIDQKVYNSPNNVPCAYINISNPGIYLFVFNLRGTSPFNGSVTLVGAGVTNTAFNSVLDNCGGSHIVVATASSYTLNISTSTTIISNTSSFFYAIRIA